ncbi:MAG: DNA recombination/repair protein RecA, partial [Pseudanabaena sp.]
IVRKGAWYSYQGDNIAQGRDNTIKYMEDKPEFAQEIERQVREKLSTGVSVSATKVAPEEVESEDDDILPDDF